MDANQTNAQMVLSGDRNLAVAGVPVAHGLLEVTAKSVVTWFKPRHNNGGNIGLADGSVQEVNSATVGKLLSSGGATNRVAIP
jgi:prepilin-type processing-associated H-X9-DG protein